MAVVVGVGNRHGLVVSAERAKPSNALLALCRNSLRHTALDVWRTSPALKQLHTEGDVRNATNAFNAKEWRSSSIIEKHSVTST